MAPEDNLIGAWAASENADIVLVFESDGIVSGSIAGTWIVSGDTLVINVTGGEEASEWFRGTYFIRGDLLVLVDSDDILKTYDRT